MSGVEVVSTAEDGGAGARDALERCIDRGGIAIFPADTLYGLACDPTDEAAIARIHALKGRDEGKPSAVLFLAPLRMREILTSAGPRTRDAIGALLPGPVTLVIANPAHLYPLACAEHPEHLGIRLIEGPLAGAHVALFQTSANRAGLKPPHRLEDVDPAIRAGADLVIDGGAVDGRPSTVLDVTSIESGSWSVLREGARSTDEVAAALDSVT